MKRAMILAAGRGQRMGELTARCPKPLLRVNGRYLIDYAISSIKLAGIHEIVINVSYHGDQIKNALGNGMQYGVSITYSEEAERLETGGGILAALPLLGKEPFIVVSSDIMTDYSLKELPHQPQGLAHLVMVSNPAFHPGGDYALQDGIIRLDTGQKLTYANVGVYRRELFSQKCDPGHFRLSTVLSPAITAGQVSGEHYHGVWHRWGTPADLAEVK